MAAFGLDPPPPTMYHGRHGPGAFFRGRKGTYDEDHRLRASSALALAGITGAAAQPKNVAITAIVEHPALDAVRDGVKKGLADLGYAEGTDVAFTYESAQGNPATAAQIARQFVGDAPAVIVAISTPSAQAVAAATKDIPIVFSAVTDPVAAQLVAALDAPGANVTGVSDMAPIGDHLALIQRDHARREAARRALQSGRGQLGLLARRGEDGGRGGRHRRSSRRPATKSADVQAAARSLIGKVDAIYVPTDNTIVSALESAVGVANEAKLPLYAADTDSVARGALAAVGFNYFDVGVQTAALVDRVLKGENPGIDPGRLRRRHRPAGEQGDRRGDRRGTAAGRARPRVEGGRVAEAPSVRRAGAPPRDSRSRTECRRSPSSAPSSSGSSMPSWRSACSCPSACSTSPT